MSENSNEHNDDYLFLRYMSYDLSKTNNSYGGDNFSTALIVYPVIVFISAMAYVINLLLSNRGNKIKRDDPEYFNRLTRR